MVAPRCVGICVRPHQACAYQLRLKNRITVPPAQELGRGVAQEGAAGGR